MKLTNRHGLPEPFVMFEEANKYSRGGAEISVTSLIDSPQIFRLKEQYSEELEEDVADRIFSILGTAVHAILETAEAPDTIVEERLYAEFGGKLIGGQIDLQTLHKNGTRTLTDYKTTSAATLRYNPEGKREWINQLNLYAAIARANHFDISGIEVVAIIRDWSAARTHYTNYPQHPVVKIALPLWRPTECLDYIMGRVACHNLPQSECTDEEMWKRDGKVKVYELTQKGTPKTRATRVFSNMTDAEMFSLELGKPATIVETEAEYLRCDRYCEVAQFCEQKNRRNK